MMREVNEGMEMSFLSLCADSDYKAAIDYIENKIPTQRVLNEVIFEVLFNCDENVAEKANLYLHTVLELLKEKPEKRLDFKWALYDHKRRFSSIWDISSHFVLSYLHHLKVFTEEDHQPPLIKYPNCKVLVEFYIEVFNKHLDTIELMGEDFEIHFKHLLEGINLLYENKVEKADALTEALHSLLDKIVMSKVCDNSRASTIPMINHPLWPEITGTILKECKDAFSTTKKQQEFFINCDIPCLQLKLCEQRLWNMIYPEIPVEKELTLKTIVDNFVFYNPTPSKDEDSKKPSKKKGSKKPENTELHKFCNKGAHGDLLQFLMENLKEKNLDLDLNVKNSKGRTALHEACAIRAGYHCVRFLLQDTKGFNTKVNLTATDPQGKTPLHYAAEYDLMDAAKLLLSYDNSFQQHRECPVACRDHFNNTPYDYAASEEMKTLLKEHENECLASGTITKSRGCSAEQEALHPPSFQTEEEYSLYLDTLMKILMLYSEVYGWERIQDKKLRKNQHREERCYHYISNVNDVCDQDFYTVAKSRNSAEKFVLDVRANAESIEADLSAQLKIFPIFWDALFHYLEN